LENDAGLNDSKEEDKEEEDDEDLGSGDDSPGKEKEEVKESPKKGKKGKKDKAPAKVTSVSPSSPGTKSKGKKKKQKVVEITFPREILPLSCQVRNLYLPSRALMQRMILRAIAMKEKDVIEEPTIQEVRPYINIQNVDIMV
jgi:hypothetical protein